MNHCTFRDQKGESTKAAFIYLASSNIYFIYYAFEQYSPVGTVIGRFVAKYEDIQWEEDVARVLAEASNEGFTFEFCDETEADGFQFFAIVGDELLIAQEID